MVKHLLLQHSALLFIVVLSVFFQLLLEQTNMLLSYRRGLFLEHLFSQCITPSLVHMNWMHWLFNILNLFALAILFPAILQGKRLLMLFLLYSIAIMFSLYVFSPYVVHYVGMSGVLYGLAVYASLSSLKEHKHTLVSLLVLAYILLKLLAHNWINEIMGVSQALKDMPVITEVHWSGALSGVLGIVFYTLGIRFFKFT